MKRVCLAHIQRNRQKKIPDKNLRNRRPTKQVKLDTRMTEKKCPECGSDSVFDIYEIIGGCEGEVTKIHCPECGYIFDPRKHWEKLECPE